MKQPTSAEIIQLHFRPPDGKAALDIEPMSIAELRRRAPASHFARLQRADFFHLIGVTSGRTRLMVDFGHYRMRAGHWLLVRPGQVMRYDFSKPWTGWLVVFRPETVFSDVRAAAPVRIETLPGHWKLEPEAHRALLRVVRQMAADSGSAADLGLRNEMLRHQLNGALLRLAGRQEQRTIRSPRPGAAAVVFRRLGELIEQEFAANHRVRHYARRLNVSARTLNRVCRTAAGLPAKELISQRVTLEAKRLLAHTILPVRRISDELGFAEPTHFVKFFRLNAGGTPGAFRKRQSPG